MPTYRDPQTGRAIRSDEPLSDAEIEEAFGHRDYGPESTTTTPSTDTPANRAGSYVMHKAREFVESGQNLLGDITGSQFPEPRTTGQRITDVATVAAPAIAPGLTAAGLAVGTGARALGADEPTAEGLDTAAQLAAGLGTAAVQGGRAVLAGPARLKALARAKYAEAAAGAKNVLKLGSDAGTDFYNTLKQGLESGMTHAVEKRAAEPLLRKMELAQQAGAGITYGDLDNALATIDRYLPRKFQPSYVKGLIDDAAQSLLEPAKEGAVRTAGKAIYKSLKTKPFRTGGQLGLGVAGGQLAAQDFMRGEYKKGAMTLAGTALASRGLSRLTGRGILEAGRGAALPLARTAAVVGSGLARAVGADTAGPDESPDVPVPSAPAPAEPSGTVAEAPRAPAILPGPYGRELTAAATLYKIPPRLLQVVMRQESGGHPNALSSGGAAGTPAHGLMQVTPGTFDAYRPQIEAALGRKANVDSPLDNIVAGALLYRRYLDQTDGDVAAAARLYHGGENLRAHGPLTYKYGNDIAAAFGGGG